MSLVSFPAPPFALPCVSLKSTEPRTVSLADYAGHWLLLLFYPRDFSFVCPTELTSFSARSFDFERQDCQMLGISVDSIESHAEWLRTPVADGGLGPLQFPLASDPEGKLAAQLGVWLPEKAVSARGLFLIDPEGILQYAVVHNLSVGRNVEEILRVLEALRNGGLCPASWTHADGTIDAALALHPGRVLGHYRIKRLLGEGKFGSVFSAFDLRLERTVALKVLKRDTVASREAILREARAAAPLSHPNVCTTYAVDEIDGLPVIALEYIDGHPLTESLAARLPLQQGVELARGIAAGLAAAHARHIVHGDLKPANVLVTRDSIPRILDFGLSRQSNRLMTASERPAAELPPLDEPLPPDEISSVENLDATIVTPANAPPGAPFHRGISGTPAYMSPEQSRGAEATPASDVFAWGLIFFELLTGRRAIAAKNLAQLLKSLQDPELSSSLTAEFPAQYRDLLSEALAIEPRARPTAAEILSQLS